MNREEILERLEQSRRRFLEAIDGLAEADMQRSGVIDEWSVKDIMGHVSRWEGELVTMLWQLRQGKKPDRVHIEGDEDVDAINARWHEEGKDRALELVTQDFHGVRPQTTRRVREFSNEELNDPARFEWLRGEPLWRWIAVDSFEHEEEHAEQIRAWREEQGI